ncbi:MAG: tRNA (adenine-N1)-methyltransferase [Acidimicrobiia bacterium]
MKKSESLNKFSEGDLVLLLDKKYRKYMLTLHAGTEFHCHSGIIKHDDIIDNVPGCQLRTTLGASFRVLYPTLSDYVLKMPRGAQVIYPKDHGTIITFADIFPGARVLESGVGSGALSISLLRAIGEEGMLYGYELREDFAAKAQRNVEKFMGDSLPWEVSVRDIYEGIDETDLDRIVLDLPEPWQVVKHAEKSLKSGGLIISYVPSITQAARLRQELEESNFGFANTFETLLRSWHIEGQAVRPDHRMVAHTGFLTTARLLA